MTTEFLVSLKDAYPIGAEDEFVLVWTHEDYKGFYVRADKYSSSIGEARRMTLHEAVGLKETRDRWHVGESPNIFAVRAGEAA